jgi:alcohol dehydrogenase (cytochrome c)
MKMRLNAAVAALCTGVALTVTLTAIDAGAQSNITPAPRFTGDSLVAPPTNGWPTNGGDWYNRRYSPLDQINRDNVDRLQGVWLAHLDGSGVGPQFSGESTPIVHEGTLYISTGANDIFAIDIETGERQWSYAAELGRDISTLCCGWISRGVAIGEGKVFLGRLDGRLIALDQETGAIAWDIQAERWQDGYTITSAPLYFDGLVITGFSGGERGVRGRVKAYDAADGSHVWTFYTIPGPGEVGHETWPADNELWRDGGAPVWNTPAVDPDLGMIYFSTGNAAPDYNGSQREGDNLFAVSIVAVDVRTGEYRWHFQQVHHDIWDYDSPNPVVLFDIEIDGELRQGLAQAGKTGWVYILDRSNGEPLIGIEERPVPQEPRQKTAATQPFPLGDAFVPQQVDIAPEGFELINQGRIFTPFWTERQVVLRPGVWGGANWPPSSYDPNTGYFFVCARDSMMAFKTEEIDDQRPEPGDPYEAAAYAGFQLRATGIFAAVDMHNNKLVWQQQWPEPCYSGSTVTAGGLVFVGRSDGRLTAHNTDTGELLWEFQTGAGMNAPVSIFEHEGRQYIAAYAAGNIFARSARGDNVWLFALDGLLEQVEPGIR